MTGANRRGHGQKKRRSDFSAPKKVRLRDSEGAPRTGSGSASQEPSDRVAQEGERLQKVLAKAGFGSRRACEALIAQGRVAVGGEVVREQGVRVDPHLAVIHVDGRRVQLDEEKLTIALNKPRKVMSAMEDPQGRRTLEEFAARYPVRLYHVGRLDYETEGLLLLSNDGELTHRLTHPSFEVSKTYVCRFDCPGSFPRSILAKLRSGLELEDGPAKADRASLVAHDGREAIVEVTLHEGRNRIVRRMFSALGYELTSLVRTRIGPVVLADLAPGATRELTAKELGTLMAEVGL
ncbi:rRNA pseudouridine synthase [Dermabacter sp. p3-SID358]|uniref:pseudouridine synthase n=1 Tax=Dermabacter sp. p3-SID358 TaxID=2916114 RepID=UPI0021A9745B|nr:pseudouridine synthase [Dermabacter sp. p3-SID358]MCT1866097.1 rRNA pseudouridine synthase [Dermabacter sp. p3-SID358]